MWSAALDTCHSLWSVSGSQQQINKISFLLPFTCRGSSPSRRTFSQLALALWPLRLLWDMRSPGCLWVGQECQGEIGRNSKLRTGGGERENERESLHFFSLLEDSCTSHRLTNDCPVSRRHFEVWCIGNATANKQQLKPRLQHALFVGGLNYREDMDLTLNINSRSFIWSSWWLYETRRWSPCYYKLDGVWTAHGYASICTTCAFELVWACAHMGLPLQDGTGWA